MLGASLISLDRLEVGCTEGAELWLSDGKVLGTTLGTYDGIKLGLAYCSSTAYWKFEGSVDGLDLGTNEGNKLCLRDGIVLVTTLGVMDGLPLGTYDGSDPGSSEFSADRNTDGRF